ncbi:glycosyltransferase family 2 protein [bacterium]|nr:glycosyltransferase family 2 protein [bacterium]MBU1881127.1 glycosyltransferase family 2 protein [bacterium]
MKVSGFTIVRNAVKFGYPAKESILSILPIVDEFIVAVGNSDDDTLQLIESIDSDKIRIVRSIWDGSLREHGRVLAVETNKAFDLIGSDTDWAFYLQADEVVHEKYHAPIVAGMKAWLNNPQVEGLLFDYKHFYGAYDYIGDARRWYRKEIRIIRNDKSIRSYKDAQGFRKDGRKLRVKPVKAEIYHYGWIKHPRVMQEKMRHFHRFWHDDKWIEDALGEGELFDYSQIDSLRKFDGTHPEVMEERIYNLNWDIDFNPAEKKLSFKNRLLYWIEQATGKRLGEYRNYRII